MKEDEGEWWRMVEDGGGWWRMPENDWRISRVVKSEKSGEEREITRGVQGRPARDFLRLEIQAKNVREGKDEE